jgi:leucyl/phenylalanyl-tRNA--protein transferase
MFTKISNASKAALIILTLMLKLLGFILIDCQIYSDHLKSLGAETISRRQYLDILQAALKQKTWQGSWRSWEERITDVIDSNGRSL